MNDFLYKIYINSPFFLKRAFANAEAIKRNYYRRSGNYKRYYKMINVSKMLENHGERDQLYQINLLLKYVKQHIPFFSENLETDRVNSVDEIRGLPVLSKYKMMDNINEFINRQLIKELWKGNTSGSTGTPFNYYRDRNSMQYEYALYDKLYNYLTGVDNGRKARVSGVNIVKAELRTPPFWYYIRVFNQLQCSAYHIDSNTYSLYLDAFKNHRVNFGTGFASSWLFLSQYVLENNADVRNLNSIITDSEGFSNEDKTLVEQAFKCPVYQTYGLSETGMIAVQCKNDHYHIFTDRCYVEILDSSGMVVNDGEEGEIAVTDLHSFNAPFIRYKTGDRGIMGNDNCGCGWNTPYIKELIGRLDDYIFTLDGRRISRLGFIARPAKGVLGMQLIQKERGNLDIHVLPAANFEKESMIKVLDVAKKYLGNMKVTWTLVDELEKTNTGKVRYVIRKI